MSDPKNPYRQPSFEEILAAIQAKREKENAALADFNLEIRATGWEGNFLDDTHKTLMVKGPEIPNLLMDDVIILFTDVVMKHFPRAVLISYHSQLLSYVL